MPKHLPFLKRAEPVAEPPVLGPPLGLLFFAACPLFLWVFHGSFIGLVAAALLLGLFATGLSMIRQGQRVQAAYDAAEVAYKPRFPRKIFGCVQIGLLVIVLAIPQFASLWVPFLVGMLAAGLGIAAFGPDPMRDKGTDNPEFVLRQRAAELIGATNAALDRMVADLSPLGDAELVRRTQAVQTAVMRLLRALSSDPSELRALRKPLMKFLQMLNFEVDRLVDSWEGEEAPQARTRYVAKLDALARAFEKRARKRRDSETRDAFELETDLLLDRMTHESAA